jgi:hypothetical protein
MIKPAIVVVGYDRPDSMRRILDSVIKAFYPFDDITLIISIDEGRMSNEVDKVAKSIKWPYGKVKIRRFNKRQGLRKHIIQCGDLSEQYDAVIILEDDLIVSPSFYLYAYKAVNFYSFEARIAGISLYSHAWNGYADLLFTPMKNHFDVYWGQYSITWGECWTKRQWKKFRQWYFDHENKLPLINHKMPSSISQWGEQSWGKYFISYMIEKNLYYVIPYISMSTNFSDIGQHNRCNDCSHQVLLLEGEKKDYRFPNFIQAIKYDIFFERILEGETIQGINGNDICVDLNGMKTTTLDKKYLISIKRVPFKRLASFGMAMRPIDSNIIHNVPGNDIFFYECKCNSLIENGKLTDRKRIDYEMYHFSWRVLLKVGVSRFFLALKQKLMRNKK